jgi:hypothetical protein
MMTLRPAERGNGLAVTHGGYSPRVYGETAAQLHAGILAERPQLARYGEALRAWSDLEARCEVVRSHLDEHGMLDGEGRPRPACELLLRLDRAADRARQRLGLDPRADLDLAKATAEVQHLASDLDAVRAAGRRALEARERAEVVGMARDTVEDRTAVTGVPGGSDDA